MELELELEVELDEPESFHVRTSPWRMRHVTSREDSVPPARPPLNCMGWTGLHRLTLRYLLYTPTLKTVHVVYCPTRDATKDRVRG